VGSSLGRVSIGSVIMYLPTHLGCVYVARTHISQSMCNGLPVHLTLVWCMHHSLMRAHCSTSLTPTAPWLMCACVQAGWLDYEVALPAVGPQGRVRLLGSQGLQVQGISYADEALQAMAAQAEGCVGEG
jgi:hypothetical protein